MFLAKQAKCAKPAKAAKAAKSAKCAKQAKAAKCAKAVCVLAIMASLFMAGCVARKVSAPLGVVGTDGAVSTIGDYSQWTFGVWAKEAYEDKGVSASFADGYASNGQTASSDSTASIEILKAVLPLLAQAYAPGIAVPKATVTPPAIVETDKDSAPDTAVTETPIAGALAAKMAEAKSSGKPLVVIAGNTGCGYCERLDNILLVSPKFTGRSDIILYRETSTWATNQAGKWTGGGAFPVLRVTQWAADGSIVCDHKVNRPQSVAEIEAALTTCGVPK